MRLSVRAKIVLFAIAPIAVIYFFASTYNIYRTRQWAESNIEQRMTWLASGYAHHFDTHLREVAELARTTAAVLESDPQLSPEAISDLLAANLRANPLVYGSAVAFEPYQYQPDLELFVRYVYREEGVLQKVDPVSSGYDYTEPKQEYWHLAREAGQPVWTEPYFDEGAGDIFMATYSVPFFREGEFIGIATVDIPLEPLRELIHFDTADDVKYTVLSSSGRYVYSTKTDLINKSIFAVADENGNSKLRAFAERATSGQSGVSKMSGWASDDREWLFYAPVESAGWVFIAEMSEGEALAFPMAEFRRDVMFLFISLLVVGAVFWGLSWFITHPIDELRAAVRAVAGGDLGRRIAMDRGDEIGELANAFDEMAEQLDVRTRALSSSEEKYRAYVVASPYGIYLVDSSSRFLDANPAACEMTGYSREELLELSIPDLVSPDPEAQEESASRFRKLVETGSVEVEDALLKKDGSKMYMSVKAVALTDDRYVAFGMDVTDRRVLEKKMKYAQKMESLAILAGGIAHDFNNILVGIIGNTDIALSNLSVDSPVKDNLELILSASNRAADLAQQMLAYSGKGKFQIEVVDMNELIESVGELMQSSVSKKSALSYRLDPSVPAVEVDVTQMRQVLMNLVINASEAIGDQDGLITITSGLIHCDDGCELKSAHSDCDPTCLECAFFEVTDDGCGMTEEEQAKIFDPFFTSKFAGRGLGLAAVLGIVRGHGGRIVVSSIPGEGSKFRVFLPSVAKVAVQEPIGDEVAVETRTPKAGSSRPQFQGTILVADDEDMVLRTLSIMLERLGLKVLTAIDGLAAVEVFEQHNDEIDYALLDLTMPGLDGIEAARRLYALRSDLPVIISTGYSEQSVADNLDGVSFAGYLKKPFAMSDIIEILERLA